MNEAYDAFYNPSTYEEQIKVKFNKLKTMAGGGDDNVVQFAAPVGLIYVFNLIIGTGALAMPKAFQDAGYVLGGIMTALLAFVSYLAFTFVVESMSIANALVASKKAQKLKDLAVEAAYGTETIAGSELEAHDRRSPSSFPSVVKPSYFEIEQRIEIGSMASMFLGKYGVYVFYGFLIVYLYGDLAIYSTAVPKSLMNVVCTYEPGSYANTSCISYNVSNEMPCWNRFGSHLSRITVYRMLVFFFTLLIGPFVFLNVSKTKYLQVLTTVSRWSAFVLMIGLACNRLATGHIDGHPPIANAGKFANLFGVCVYAFMCHHSLPSVITPMKSKNAIYPLVFFVYCVIFIFYITLSLTGAFAFANLEDVYTLNFLRQCSTESDNSSIIMIIFRYFLALFPVLTLSTNFPIVGITLRNNIIVLVTNCFQRPPTPTKNETSTTTNVVEEIREPGAEVDVDLQTPLLETPPEDPTFFVNSKTFSIMRRIVAPLIVVLPPAIVSLGTDNVEILASITGSYAGVGVQYVIPALLIYGARKNMGDIVECMPANYISPFSHKFWIYFLFVWATLTVIVVTVNHILTGF